MREAEQKKTRAKGVITHDGQSCQGVHKDAWCEECNLKTEHQCTAHSGRSEKEMTKEAQVKLKRDNFW